VVVPPDFARRARAQGASFQVIADGSQSLAATIASAHIAGIARDYGAELVRRQRGHRDGTPTGPQVETRIRVAYNPNLLDRWFSSLLEVLNQVTMISMLLAAAALVREREHGTLEHLLASPLRPGELFVAKVTPAVVLVPAAAVGSVLGIVHAVFATPIRGSILLFYGVTMIYVFAMASLGLAIATFARNLGQAVLILLLVLYPLLFLSGAFTPPESMGTLVRTVGLLSPVRHYVDFGYQVLFKGSGPAEVWPQAMGILVLGTVLFGLSVLRFGRLVR
jgi:ABC-2 type transport system permease protein